MRKYAKRLHVGFIYRFSMLIILPFLLILSFLLYISNHVSQRNDQNANEKLASQVIYNLSQNMNFAEKVADAILQNGMLVNFLDKSYRSRVDLEYYSSTIYDYVKISNGISSDFRLRIYLENESIPLGYSTFYHMKDLRQIEPIQQFYRGDEEDFWMDGSSIKENKRFYHTLNAQDR